MPEHPPYLQELESFLDRAKRCGETTYNEACALLEKILHHHKPPVTDETLPEVNTPSEPVNNAECLDSNPTANEEPAGDGAAADSEENPDSKESVS